MSNLREDIRKVLQHFEFMDHKVIARGIKEEDFLVYFQNEYIYPTIIVNQYGSLMRAVGHNLEGSEEKIIFLHVPKTAGTSLYYLFLNVFGEENVSPAFQSSLVIPLYFFLKYKVIWGHFFFSEIKAMPVKKKIIVSFVRDPIERLWSTYRYQKKFHTKSPLEEVPWSKLAKELDPISYFKHPDIVETTRNGMTKRLLDGRLYHTINKELEKIDSLEGRKEYLQTKVRSLIREHIGSNFAYIGVVEIMDKSVRKLLETLGVERQLIEEATSNIPKLNVSDKEDLTEEVIEVLEGLVELDKVLYEEVISLFHNVDFDRIRINILKTIYDGKSRKIVYAAVRNTNKEIYEIKPTNLNIETIYIKERKDWNLLCIVPVEISQIQLIVRYEDNSEDTVELKL